MPLLPGVKAYNSGSVGMPPGSTLTSDEAAAARAKGLDGSWQQQAQQQGRGAGSSYGGIIDVNEYDEDAVTKIQAVHRGRQVRGGAGNRKQPQPQPQPQASAVAVEALPLSQTCRHTLQSAGA